MNRTPGYSCLLLVLFVVPLLAAAPVQAVKDIHVVALFKDRVMVMIDGKKRLLRTGETSPEGVELISADSSGAVFDYEGKTLQRRLDGRARSPASRVVSGEPVQVFRDTMGMFTTVGSINGMPVNFLVDTGATSVAMNANEARRLGIDYLVVGDATYVSTASDVTRAYRVMLDKVKVGHIELHNVEAVVIDGPMPREALLGMSFLGRLELRNQGDYLMLRKKY